MLIKTVNDLLKAISDCNGHLPRLSRLEIVSGLYRFEIRKVENIDGTVYLTIYSNEENPHR
jgi:hypothetical protein